MILIAWHHGCARPRTTPFSARSTFAAEKLEVSHSGVGNGWVPGPDRRVEAPLGDVLRVSCSAKD